MKHLFFIFAIACIIQVPADCQDYEAIQGFKIGITPSALLNRWIGFQGKASYMHKNYSLDANFGYLHGTDNEEPYSGFRIRTTFKYYYRETSMGWHYLGIGGLHRKIDHDAVGTFGRFNNSFFQELDFKMTQKITGFYLMSGTLIPIKEDRFFMDVGLGLGRAVVNIKHFDIPDDAILIYEPPLFRSDLRTAGSYNYYLLFFGHFSVMYKF